MPRVPVLDNHAGSHVASVGGRNQPGSTIDSSPALSGEKIDSPAWNASPGRARAREAILVAALVVLLAIAAVLFLR